MSLSPFARIEWTLALVCGGLLAAAAALMTWWWLIPLPLIAAAAVLAFFRDPARRIPSQRGIMLAPCDGRVSSIFEVDDHPDLGGPAVCVRIFMSVFDVHINRAPCHGAVARVEHRPGNHGNTLNPDSIEDNEAVTTLLVHPTRSHPVACIRQVAGLLARTIYNSLEVGQVVQRGQRFGLIKLGSTTELYIPAALSPEIRIRQGDACLAGETVVAEVVPPTRGEGDGADAEATATDT